MKTAIIGGGVMGTAILERALQAGTLRREDVLVAEVIAARREQVADAHGVATTGTASEAMEDAQIILLAVKPSDPNGSYIFTKTDPTGAGHQGRFVAGAATDFAAFKTALSTWIAAEQ